MMLLKKLKFLILIVLVFNMLYNVVCFASEIQVVRDEALKELGIEIDMLNSNTLLMVRKILHSIPDYEAVQTSVANMKKMDINGDGKEDIVALINFQGTTANPFEVFLICSVQDNFVTQRLRTKRAIMEKTVVDLNVDGIYEICLNTRIIGGHTPMVLAVDWVDVYAWDGQAYVQQNDQFFESFYLHRYLPYLSQRLYDAGQGLKLGETRKNTAAILQDCRTALERVAAMSTTHHLPESQHLAESAEIVRQNLPQVFKHIEEAQTLLQHEGSLDEIANLIEKSRTMLQQLSPLLSPKTD